jgi:ankyrin repeat protein
MAFAAQPVLQILGDLEVDVQRKLACHPACLYVLIEQRESGIVDEILQAGIEREKFDETPGKAFEWMSGDARHQSVTWGSACLAEAAAAGWLSTVETLLQLGIDVNAPDVQALAVGYTPLNLAIKADNSEMVELLLRSGAHVKIFDDGEPVFSRGNKIYPLVNAIARENENIMRAILSEQKEPLPVSSAYAYIRYAYMTRSPKSLACLVTFDCLQPNVTSPDEGNTHLIEIIKNISAICTVARERYFDSDSDSDDDSVSWSLSIRTKLARVRIWVECLILLARARISPTVKNHAGVSALDLFDGLLNYEGPDRFKKHVRSALRSRLNDVMGEKVAMNFLPPDTTFEALKLCEVDLAESVSGTSDSE